MANILVNETAQLVQGGGGLTETEPRFIGDGSNTYVAGQLCYLVGNVVTPVATSAGALTTSTTAFSAANKFVIVNQDYDTATSDFMDVQEIDEDTVFKGAVVNTAADDVTMDGTDQYLKYQLYQDLNGRLALNNVATTPIALVVEVDAVSSPWRSETRYKDSGGVQHSQVSFKILPTIALS